MLHVLCANERCSFILSCDGADQTSHEEGEEEKLERQCRAVSRACMQEEVGTARAQRACAWLLLTYQHTRTPGVKLQAYHHGVPTGQVYTALQEAGPYSSIQRNTDKFLFKVCIRALFLSCIKTNYCFFGYQKGRNKTIALGKVFMSFNHYIRLSMHTFNNHYVPLNTNKNKLIKVLCHRSIIFLIWLINIVSCDNFQILIPSFHPASRVTRAGPSICRSQHPSQPPHLATV